MRVLCYGRFYDNVPGGMQRHVEHLFSSLKDTIDFVHLVPSRDFSGHRFTLHGYPVIRTPSWNVDGSLALSPGLITETFRQQKKNNFDLVHLHFPDPMSHLASLAISRKVPRIITWHADIVRQRHMRGIYQPMLISELRKASAIIVATPEHIISSPLLSRSEFTEKIRIIPYGFDLTRFSRPDPQLQQVRNNHPYRYIFALGRHVYYKGFDVLIKAMKRLGEDVHLVLGGEGPLTQTLQSLVVQENLQNRVHILGMINDELLPAYYQGAELFCLPSISTAEAFGIVQVEAMAAGCPVVNTQLNNGVNHVSIDGQTGFTVPPNDVLALAERINYLLAHDELRKTMGLRARERVLSEFSHHAMAEKTLEIYKMAAGQQN